MAIQKSYFLMDFLFLQDGDGLHLVPEGQRFVGTHLVELLRKIGASPKKLPMELPQTFQIDCKNFERSFLAHQKAARRDAFGKGGATGNSKSSGGDRDRDRDAGKLFVGSLSSTTTGASLRAAFSRFGPISEAFVVMDRDNPAVSRGIGFVTFVNPRDADAATSAMNGTNLDGRRIRVDAAGKGGSGKGNGKGGSKGGGKGNGKGRR